MSDNTVCTGKEEGAGGVRVWVDGCFDMVHFGHANAIRQAKAMGDYLIVGVHSDDEIRKHKGPPVFRQEERYKMVRAIKWVDEVVEGAPYVTTVETLDKYKCDFCVHGDDITTTADGEDTYQLVKDARRYKECSRTHGVSTTDIVGRMLLSTRQHHVSDSIRQDISAGGEAIGASKSQSSPWTRSTQFLASSRKIVQFANEGEPKPGDRIVYCPGSYDLFHVGHVDFLRKAKKLGDYVIVGLYSDTIVNKIWKGNFPIMNIHERVLSVLACRYVDEVIIGAPYSITKELIDHFKVGVICHGRTGVPPEETVVDPMFAAKDLNLYKEIDSGNDLGVQDILDRIIENRLQYERRNRIKEEKELAIIKAIEINQQQKQQEHQ